jgi:HYR domain
MSHGFLRRSRMLAGALAVLGASSLALASGASAHSFSVSNTAEFVKAVAEANADAEANTIVVAAGSYLPEATVKFTNKSGVQTIEGPATGAPARLLGSAVEPFPSELFVIEAGTSVTFKKVEISIGGGLGVASVVDLGTLALEASTDAGNKGAGVLEKLGATATVTNSTISDGSEFGFINDAGTASFFNSTVAFNKTGGIESTGTLNLTNTIVAENTASGGSDCTGAATTSDHSLDSDGSCGVEKSAVNPLLQTQLLNDGGSTSVHSLKPGSPAIGAGDEATCTKESQEGFPRPGIPGKPCDIGADEYNETKPTLKLPANITAGDTSSAGREVTFTPEASSPDAAIRTLICTPASGSTFAVATTTVECVATDGHENKTSGTFSVTIHGVKGSSNGALLGTKREPAISFGEVTLKNAVLNEVKCKVFTAGTLWNEATIGFGEITGFTAFECKAASPCEVTNEHGVKKEGTFISAEGPPEAKTEKGHRTGSSSLPWTSEDIERETGTRQSVEHRVKLWLVVPLAKAVGGPGEGAGCEKFGGDEGAFEDKEGAEEKAAGDELAPKIVNGVKNGLTPSKDVFEGEKTEKSGAPETGRLISATFGPGYVTGSMLSAGSAAFELDTAK